jgi:hypothetical protein
MQFDRFHFRAQPAGILVRSIERNLVGVAGFEPATLAYVEQGRAKGKVIVKVR